MTIGRIIFIGIACLVLALITGIVTRNILIALLFPVLLIIFLLMWNALKKSPPKPPVQQ